MLLLASQGHFFHPTRHTIDDKSKANILAKILICVQVLWMVGQVLERKVAEYPITLLEIHTIVHVICALTMYILWMRKPYDVQDPTCIPAEDFQQVLAFMVTSTQWEKRSGFILTRAGRLQPEKNWFGMSSPDPPLQWFGSLAQQDWPLVGEIGELEDSEGFREKATAEIKPSDGQLISLDELPGNDVITYRNTVRENPEGTPQHYSAQKIQRRYVADTSDATACTLVSGQALSTGLGPYMVLPRLRPNVRNAKTSSDADQATRILRRLWEKYRKHILEKARTQGSLLSLSHKDVHRLNLAGTFINEQIQSKLKPGSVSTAVPFDPFNDRRFHAYGERLLTFREQNWTGILDLLDSFDYFGKLGVFLVAFLLAIVFVFLPGAYGGVHYAAISIGFPSAIERLLWEISCFFLLGAAALIPACFPLFLGGAAIAVVLTVVLLLGELANFFIKKASGVNLYKIISKKATSVWKSSFEPEKQREEPTAGEEVDKDSAVRIWTVFLIQEYKQYKPKSPAGKAAYWLMVTILWVIGLLIYILIVGVVLAYIVARIFIVVEVFLSLRSVSIGVYQTPHINFMNYIPHF
jgi:membrane protein implicated in regulation of membrane protease activity